MHQRNDSREFDRISVSSAVALPIPNHKDAQTAGIERFTRKPVPSSAALIGRLSVPRLHVSAMVREGIDRETLQLAIGHIPATALPGQQGNVGLAGHRDTFFRRFKELKIKDEIRFSTWSGDFRYVVESIVIVEPDNVGVLDLPPKTS